MKHITLESDAVFIQIKQACDFINSRNDVFKDCHGPVVQLLIDYIGALEDENYQYKEKFSKIKEIIEEQ